MQLQEIQDAIKEVANGDAVLLDVRRDDEWAEGHAEQAVHFDSAKIEAGELPDIPKDKKIYVYCKSGGRAGKSATIMQNNGFADVHNLGGLTDWLSAGGK